MGDEEEKKEKAAGASMGEGFTRSGGGGGETSSDGGKREDETRKKKVGGGDLPSEELAVVIPPSLSRFDGTLPTTHRGPGAYAEGGNSADSVESTELQSEPHHNGSSSPFVEEESRENLIEAELVTSSQNITGHSSDELEEGMNKGVLVHAEPLTSGGCLRNRRWLAYVLVAVVCIVIGVIVGVVVSSAGGSGSSNSAFGARRPPPEEVLERFKRITHHSVVFGVYGGEHCKKIKTGKLTMQCGGFPVEEGSGPKAALVLRDTELANCTGVAPHAIECEASLDGDESVEGISSIYGAVWFSCGTFPRVALAAAEPKVAVSVTMDESEADDCELASSDEEEETTFPPGQTVVMEASSYLHVSRFCRDQEEDENEADEWKLHDVGLEACEDAGAALLPFQSILSDATRTYCFHKRSCNTNEPKEECEIVLDAIYAHDDGTNTGSNFKCDFGPKSPPPPDVMRNAVDGILRDRIDLERTLEDVDTAGT
jgi:hypothetical protein